MQLPLMVFRLLFQCLVVLMALAPSSRSETLLIAAAADMKFALDEVLVEFNKTHPGHDTKATYGSSGALFAQLDNGAPFDIFFSADIKFPRTLVERGRGEGASLFSYAIGHLVVWVPNGSKIEVEKLGMSAVLEPTAKKIAIANPKVAPYGAAAAAAMEKMGVYSQVSGRLVLGENVAQAAQFVQSGAADIGILSLSLALSPRMKNSGRYWKVPVESYPSLEQAAVISVGAKNRAGAQALAEFVKSPQGVLILTRYGFALPEGTK